MLKSLARELVFGAKANPRTYIERLKEMGVVIGEDVSIYVPTKTLIDESYPWMLTIGDHVRIAQGVTILTHDYSWSVLKQVEGEILGASGRVTIGNNVFIGMHATILRGVTIGDNVIIGSGAVVTKDCEADGVYAGNPARRIAELDDFLKKRRLAQVDEARELAVAYFERYHRRPPEDVFHEYFMIFLSKEEMLKRPWCVAKMKLGGNEQKSLLFAERFERPFRDYQDFMKYCFG